MPATPSALDPAIQVFGAAKIWIGVSGTWYPLGFTRNGVDQTDEAFWLDVPGDEYGGDDGPPLDVQFLGAVVRLRCELTKWNVDNVNIIRARLNTPGALIGHGYINCSAIGELALQGDGEDSYSFPLVIEPACLNSGQVYGAYIFYRAIPRMPIEINHATKFSTVVCEFECHRVSSGTYTGWIYSHASYTYPAGPRSA